ncbi:MAG: ApaLI family restriction endonuclease, partial [Bacteroidota bacterium]
MNELKQDIKNLAEIYSANLRGKIEARKEEMKADDNSHYLI